MMRNLKKKVFAPVRSEHEQNDISNRVVSVMIVLVVIAGLISFTLFVGALKSPAPAAASVAAPSGSTTGMVALRIVEPADSGTVGRSVDRTTGVNNP